MVKEHPHIRLGLIGCGSFGKFCLSAFNYMDQVKIIAVADSNSEPAQKTGQSYAVDWHIDPHELILRKDIDIIHIVTPPSSHYPLAIEAIQQGKHVLCEKPLALTIEEADDLLKEAKQNERIIPVNFVLRYVKTANLVKQIIDSHALGEPIRAYFENYASDENLGSQHWFWDKEQSGGIFIEHGVHFFDLYRYWFGDADVIWASAQKRIKTIQEDRVFCTLAHKSGVLATHYHGFDQPNALDRQFHRLLFELGDIVVNGWIPQSLTLTGLVDDAKLDILKNICPDANVTLKEKYESSNQIMRGRGKIINTDKYIQLDYNSPIDKLSLYSEAIKVLLNDQISYLVDSKHPRMVTEENGRRALILGLQASKFIE
jgi:predicted dehydrogenase